MSDRSDVARLRFVLAKIDDLQEYQARFPSVEALFHDSMACDAVLMCLLQIGETIQKVENKLWSAQLPVHGAYVVRNIIAHDYEGVDLSIIEKIISEDIPSLRMVVVTLLSEITS
ncbi:MAG TPA: DUF86 domain-containing protein [Candidatus Ozemobacteraceae bacterium]|nr:DUF86 domain-containing protein [Candidatus Ozemobacteraceae bacterium]HQG27006.1 DUF86 domain-containing protein [Candidatus Ozemobacteraceae bacterium]